MEQSRAVHGAVAMQVHAERVPLQLGGDHSLAAGSASAVAKHCRERGLALGVLWLDAQAGVDASVTTPCTHLHVSLDLDALDPQLAPGVRMPAPAG
jgi:arginase